METYVKGQKNKAFLWNILYENKVFVSIPQSHLNEVKRIFDDTVNNGFEGVPPNSELVSINRHILQKLKTNIESFKGNLLQPIYSKDNFNQTKTSAFDSNLERHSKSLQEFTETKQPKTVSFEEKADEAMSDNQMSEILQRIQQERTLDLPPSTIRTDFDSSLEPLSDNKMNIQDNTLLSDTTLDKSFNNLETHTSNLASNMEKVKISDFNDVISNQMINTNQVTTKNEEFKKVNILKKLETIQQIIQEIRLELNV